MLVSRLFVSISAFILYSSTVNTVAIAAGVSKKGAVETLSIQAVRETVPVASTGDAADDPAIWRNPADPARSLIVATDKDWGLHVYDLEGAVLASAPAGKVNNVDLRADVLIGGKKGVLVAATDRSEGLNGKLALYALESAPAGLRHLGHVPVAGDRVGSVYGFCLWRRAADQVIAIVPYNNGDVREYALDLSGPIPTATLVREVKLASKTEGCVVDDRTGLLYVAEERHGIWRMNAAPGSQEAPTLFAAVDGVRLIPDIEGLTLVPKGARGGVLLASSQNDNAYVAYDLSTGRYVRRFRIAGSGQVDGVTDTDGLEFAPGDFGRPFKEGLLVVQDGDNAPENQNFKLVPGGALKRVLKAK